MKRTGYNMQSVKTRNRSLVLYMLNEEGAMSRKDISKRMGLTPAAVTKICAELIDENLIYEQGEAKVEDVKAGRREILLNLCLTDKYIFGIHAESDAIVYSVSNLAGQNQYIQTHPFTEDVSEVIRLGQEFLLAHSVDTKTLLGMGVCTIGSVKRDDFGLWKGDNIEAQFEEAFGLPVVIENNVKAFAESELIYGNLHHSSSVLFFKWGPGVGSAIVANGKVFSGNDSGIAEIGHYIVNPNGKQCRCGRRGCLETETSMSVLAQTMMENKEEWHNSQMLKSKVDMVALALMNTATILNTQEVVLFGSMFYNNNIVDSLKQQCKAYANMKFDVDSIRLTENNAGIGYIGPAAICAKRFFYEKEPDIDAKKE